MEKRIWSASLLMDTAISQTDLQKALVYTSLMSLLWILALSTARCLCGLDFLFCVDFMASDSGEELIHLPWPHWPVHQPRETLFRVSGACYPASGLSLTHYSHQTLDCVCCKTAECYYDCVSLTLCLMFGSSVSNQSKRLSQCVYIQSQRRIAIRD